MEGADSWFRAVLAQDSRQVMSLIDKWARSRTAEGETALMLAVRSRSQDMVRILVPHEAGLLTPSGETSLAIAVQIDAPELCVTCSRRGWDRSSRRLNPAPLSHGLEPYRLCESSFHLL